MSVDLGELERLARAIGLHGEMKVYQADRYSVSVLHNAGEIVWPIIAQFHGAYALAMAELFIAVSRDAAILSLIEENKRLRATEERLLRENDVLLARQREWEKQVCIIDPFPMMRAVQDTTFGDTVPPIPTPKIERLTGLLSQLAAIRSAAEQSTPAFDATFTSTNETGIRTE